MIIWREVSSIQMKIAFSFKNPLKNQPASQVVTTSLFASVSTRFRFGFPVQDNYDILPTKHPPSHPVFCNTSYYKFHADLISAFIRWWILIWVLEQISISLSRPDIPAVLMEPPPSTQTLNQPGWVVSQVEGKMCHLKMGCEQVTTWWR